MEELDEGGILHVLFRRTCTEYCRILDIEHQRGLVRANLITIMQGEYSYILFYSYHQPQNQVRTYHGTSPSTHTAYPNRQNPTAGSRVQAACSFDFGKVFSAFLTNAAMMGMTVARCMLGSVVCCPGIGIPRFWHLVILV